MNLLKLGRLLTKYTEELEEAEIPAAIEVTPIPKSAGLETFEFALSVNVADVVMIVEEYRVIPYTKSDRLRGIGPVKVLDSIKELLNSY